MRHRRGGLARARWGVHECRRWRLHPTSQTRTEHGAHDEHARECETTPETDARQLGIPITVAHGCILPTVSSVEPRSGTWSDATHPSTDHTAGVSCDDVEDGVDVSDVPATGALVLGVAVHANTAAAAAQRSAAGDHAEI